MQVDQLLLMLGASAFDAMSHEPLGVAYDGRCVKIVSGEILRELERIGNPFARFVRALRQGLGNRHDDPIVAEALDLFRNRFPSLQHGAAVRDHQAVAGAVWHRREDGRAVRRARDDQGRQPRRGRFTAATSTTTRCSGRSSGFSTPKQLDKMGGGKDDGGKPTKLAVNVIDDHAFDKITTIERVAPDADAHRRIALEIRRHSDRVRHYFEQMGLNYVPRRARIRGRAFDRTRVQAVVIRRDPRMLVARELTITTDLFIGVVIDCSGSMRTGESMDKAHRFGVLLAEAIAGCRTWRRASSGLPIG